MKSSIRIYSPGAICRLDNSVIQAMECSDSVKALLYSSLLYIIAGSTFYGAAFGLWRSPLQALYSAIKFPLLIIMITLFTALINTMLALVQGCRLSFIKTITCMSSAFAITSLLLGALSPIVIYLSTQLTPSTKVPDSIPIYFLLLLSHITIIGICGVAGNIRLYRLLCQYSPSPMVAKRVVFSWIIICAFVGCELSWICSPFLARPDLETPVLNPNAFTSNFFEYSWSAVINLLNR